ncbi:MAG: UDP-glucose 4-epimerase GalE [Saprospiraceae bacterium]
MRKILVTGATGYIGSHTLIDLIQNGYDVVSVDNESNSHHSVLQQVQTITGYKCPHYKVDLCNLEHLRKIFEDHGDIEGVIHFAAAKSVGESVEKPLFYFQNNVLSLINVLQESIRIGIKAFIFSSSCTVYGNVLQSPVDEDTPWQEAASPYGLTKQMGEQIIKHAVKNTDMKAINLRYFNPAGAHPSGIIGESPRNIAQNLVPVITETAIGKREKMIVFGDDYPTRDGSCVRDYIHVCDLAHAHTLGLDYIFKGRQSSEVEVFNLGIGEGLTVFEIIEAFKKETNQPLTYIVGNRRAGDVVAIYSDYEKAERLLGWSPRYDVNDIMKTAWEWEKNRQKLEFQ